MDLMWKVAEWTMADTVIMAEPTKKIVKHENWYCVNKADIVIRSCEWNRKISNKGINNGYVWIETTTAILNPKQEDKKGAK